MPCAIAILALAMAGALDAAPVSRDEALGRASQWLGTDGGAKRGGAKRGQSPHARMRPTSAPNGKVETYARNGTNLFHLVALDGGGFVTIPADDALPPILGFSTSGELPDEDPANPFWALVGADAEAALARPENAIRAAAASNPVTSDSGIDDLRVAPLVQSKWDQSTVGEKKVYNYYTPNGYVCGCVATAMAQLMRFHQFPTAAIAPKTFCCAKNNVPIDLTMIGKTYDWGNMPLIPNSSITDIQCEAIGRLCYDAGVAAHMAYNTTYNGGSSAYVQFAHDFLTSTFNFASAESYITETTVSESQIYAGILANLDAGFPVLLGIFTASNAGHAIVADGYGYADGALYCHLNMGWSGSCDYWYVLPIVSAKSYKFTQVGAITYNIFPHSVGELVTGRVLSPSGDPVEGAEVKAKISYKTGRFSLITRTMTTNVTTSSSGHYAIFAPTGTSSTVTLSASYGRWVSTNSATAKTSASKSPYNIQFSNFTNITYHGASYAIGNSWGNDLYLAPTNTPPEFTIFSIARAER